LINTRNDRPGIFERATECEVLEVANKLIASVLDKAGDCRFVSVNARALGRQQSFFRDVAGGNMTGAVALDHRQGAAGKIAQTAGKVAISALDQILVAESPVLSEHHFAQTKITDGIDRKESIEHIQLDRVAERL